MIISWFNPLIPDMDCDRQIRVLDKEKHAYKYKQRNILVLGLCTVSTKNH
jgi:hypothetical protein